MSFLIRRGVFPNRRAPWAAKHHSSRPLFILCLRLFQDARSEPGAPLLAYRQQRTDSRDRPLGVALPLQGGRSSCLGVKQIEYQTGIKENPSDSNDLGHAGMRVQKPVVISHLFTPGSCRKTEKHFTFRETFRKRFEKWEGGCSPYPETISLLITLPGLCANLFQQGILYGFGFDILPFRGRSVHFVLFLHRYVMPFQGFNQATFTVNFL